MICRFCGGEVTLTKPGIDYCMFCFYEGRSHDEELKSLTLAAETIPGVTGAGVYHTGGGIFVYEVRLKDGSWLWASGSLSDDLPGLEGPWGVYHYQSDDDEEGFLLGDRLDHVGLIAAIRDVAQ